MERDIPYEYENLKIAYHKPQTDHYYKPDIELENGILIEVKGEFTAADRKKHIWVRDCNPDLDIRFVFANSSQTLTKRPNSKSYGKWCEVNGFKYADKEIPQEWIDE